MVKHFVKKIGSNRRVLDKKVLMDVEPPFALVSAYRTGRGTQKAVAGVGGVTKEKDEKEKTQLVLSCRGEKTRTSDFHVPNVAR